MSASSWNFQGRFQIPNPAAAHRLHAVAASDLRLLAMTASTFCSEPSDTAPLGSCARPEKPAQSLEKVESAPGIWAAPMVGAEAERKVRVGDRPNRDAAASRLMGDARPENPAQSLEKVESAPGIGPAPMAGARTERQARPGDRPNPEAGQRASVNLRLVPLRRFADAAQRRTRVGVFPPLRVSAGEGDRPKDGGGEAAEGRAPWGVTDNRHR